MQSLALRWKRRGLCIGFVPTMGALHAGHLRLVEEARKKSDRVVVSIYVNPTQFGPKEDFSLYPRPIQADLKKCKAAGADVVFNPANLYEKDSSTWVTEETCSQGRCGASRPGHFRGVATVVLKLLNIVQPNLAFFGWKDAQQVEVIRRMTRDLHVPVKIVPVEIVRDFDGLALSSRNVYLSEKERQTALALPLLLRLGAIRKNGSRWVFKELNKIAGIKVDYVEEVEGRLCAAIRVGKTRLIDNVECERKVT